MGSQFMPANEMAAAPATVNHTRLWAQKQDWETYRSVIEHLYRQTTLPNVIQTMENQYGFRATRKMYTTHFKEWDLLKNIKDEEMRAIVHKKKYRTDHGKDSNFFVRGQPVTEDDLEQYFRRKKLTIEEVLSQRRNQVTPQAVECCTPVPRPITDPDVFAIPEAIIRSIRDYHRGFHHNGRHDSIQQYGPYHALKTWGQIDSDLYFMYQRIIHACRLFKIGNAPEAGRSLVSATTSMKSILLKEDPSNLLQLLQIILDCSRHSVSEVALATWRFFYNLGEVVLGKTHPLVWISGSMASLDTPQLVRVAAMALEGTADDISNTLGPMNGTAFDARLLSIATVDAHHDRNKAGTKLREIWKHCATTLGDHDYRTLDAGIYLAFDCLHATKYQEAGQVAQDVLTHTEELQNSSADVDDLRTQQIFLDALYALALCNWILGNATVGMEYVKDAIRQRRLTWGAHDGKARSWQEMLKEWTKTAPKMALLKKARSGPQRPPILRVGVCTPANSSLPAQGHS